MKKVAYLETNNGEWYDDFVYISNYPLIDLGFDVVKFESINYKEFFDSKVIGPYDIIVGCVESTNYFFKKINVSVDYIGYPEELNKYYRRKIYKSTLGELPKKFPYFVKPANDVKLFTGSLLEKEAHIEIIKNFSGKEKLPNNLPVFISEPIAILSEYRCFVYKKNLVGIRYYAGSFDKYINTGVVRDAIKLCGGPISYTLDFCVDGNGDTTLIEINDFWAIGNYGLDGKLYVRMLIDRIYELRGFKN